MPKIYFYDTGQVLGDSGIKLENVVACSLLKEIHFRQDCFGEIRKLSYIRNKNGKEIDFLVTGENKQSVLLEVKWSDTTLSSNFRSFSKYFPDTKMIQIVKELKREKTFPDGAEIRRADKWLATLLLP